MAVLTRPQARARQPLALIRENQVVSNTTGRKYFSTDIKPDEVHCKLQNYIYLQICTHCGIQYVGESITPLNLRVNNHRIGKSKCEIFAKMQHFRSKSLKSCRGNGYGNGIKNNAMLEYRFQREDYWMKTFCTVYYYGQNERTKFMNKDSPIGRLSPPLPRYAEHFIDTRTQSKITNHDLSSDIEIFFNFLKQFLIKYRSNECRELLEIFKKREVKLLGR